MSSLTEKITDFFNGLNEVQLIKYWNENLDIPQDVDLNIVRANLTQLVIMNYDDYIKRIEAAYSHINENISEVNFKLNYTDKLSPKDKKLYGVMFYYYFKFNKTKPFIQFLVDLGIIYNNSNYLKSIEEIEDVIFEIIMSGVLVNALFTFILIDMMFSLLINEQCMKMVYSREYYSKYDRRINVSKTEVLIKNTFRKLKENNDRQHKKSAFEEMLLESYNRFKDFDNVIKGLDYKQIMLTLNRDEDYSLIKPFMRESFSLIIKKQGKGCLYKRLKPLFYLLFNKDILLREEQYYNSKIYAKYDGDYNIYYVKTIETLTGM